jgi:hypothetical protein
MSQNKRLKQKFRYYIDNMMSKGAPAMIGLLASASLIIVLLSTIILMMFKERLISQEDLAISAAEAFWISLMRIIDPGNVSADSGWAFRLVMLVLPTMGGILVFSTLIGVISNEMEHKLTELRKGRSVVLEDGHTVILGWSPLVIRILKELIEANLNQHRPAIAILADKHKVEMEDMINIQIPDHHNMRIMCRSGSTIDPLDLELVSPHTAKSIIIAPTLCDGHDNFTLKTILAITNNKNRKKEPYHIIAQINDQEKSSTLDLLTKNDIVCGFLTEDIVARLIAQASRQVGLSHVYTDLLNFEGDELYFIKEQNLVGKTFSDVIAAFPAALVIGLIDEHGDDVRINPDNDVVISARDQLIVLAEDDIVLEINTANISSVYEDAIRKVPLVEKIIMDSIMILGWNKYAPVILREFNKYLEKNASVTVIACETYQDEVGMCCRDVDLNMVYEPGDITDKNTFHRINMEKLDHVVILADPTLGIQEADTQSIIALLNLRELSEKNDLDYTIITEMLDPRNRDLARCTRINDFIISSHFIALVMAQLSENHRLMPVFHKILSANGIDICQYPAQKYLYIDQPVNFYTVIEAVKRQDQIALGYRIANEQHDQEKSFGIHLNPNKLVPIKFTKNDQLIVFSGH